MLWSQVGGGGLKINDDSSALEISDPYVTCWTFTHNDVTKKDSNDLMMKQWSFIQYMNKETSEKLKRGIQISSCQLSNEGYHIRNNEMRYKINVAWYIIKYSYAIKLSFNNNNNKNNMNFIIYMYSISYAKLIVLQNDGTQ